MKVTVELDLNYISEDPDEYVEQKVIEKIVGNVDSKIKELISRQFDNLIVEKVDSILESVVNEFMNRNIIITDRYGDEVNRYESVRELLKEKFDDFITGKVDEKGKSVNDKKGCFINGKTRIEYIASDIVNEYISKFKQEVVKESVVQINERIKSAKAEVKKEIADKYITYIEFGVKYQELNK